MSFLRRTALALAVVTPLSACEGHPPSRRQGRGTPSAAAPSAQPIATASIADPGAVSVAVPGLAMTPPPGSSPWPANELERLKAGMMRLMPDATDVTMSGARQTSGGMIALRMRQPLLVQAGDGTVRDRMNRELNAIEKALIGNSPVAPKARKRAERDGGLEVCIDGASGKHGGASVQTCLFVYADATRQATLLYSMCSEKGTSQCGDVIATRRYQTEDALSLDASLPSSRQPGLEDLEDQRIGWIEFGMEREAFEKACAKAGGKVNEFGSLPEQQRKLLLKAGQISQCSELKMKTTLGEVVEIDANFSSGGLGLAVLDTPRKRADVIATVNRSLLGLRKEGDISIYALTPDAEGDQLAELSVYPAVEGGPGASIRVFSQKGLAQNAKDQEEKEKAKE